MLRVDANYIVRYLVYDNVEMADIAEEILTTKNVFIANEVLAEVAYVLLGVYETPREVIVEQLLALIAFENVSVSDYVVVQKALILFKSQSLDFVDCLLCAHSLKDKIATFDKKLKRCIQGQKEK